HYLTINRIQRSINASTVVEMEQRPRVQLSPRETNEPPIVFFSNAGAAKIAQQNIPIQGMTPGQLQGIEPFTQEQMEAILTITEPVEVESPGPQSPAAAEDGQTAPPQNIVVRQPVFTPEDFVVIDDHLAAEADQAIYDILWDRAGADYAWFDNVLYKHIFGYQPGLVQWDFQRHCYSLTNEHHLHVLIDPTATGIEDADYLIFDQPMSADEAKSKYPQYAAAIDREAQQGKLVASQQLGLGTELAASWRDTNFERPVIVIRTAWLRHQPYPMSEQDALERGLVQPAMRDVLDEKTQAFVPQPVVDDAGNPIYQLIEDGRPGALTAPDNDNWPTRTGIRQLLIIGDQVVEDVECPYVDIPFIWNINVPIPFSPYGQGDPERLFDINQFVDRIASNLGDHVRYYAAPQEYWPASVTAANKNHNTHAHPGRHITVPDDVYARFLAGRSNGFAVDPPNPPAMYVELLGLGLRLLDEESDYSQVLQGNVPSGIESGRAISLLQNAARSMISFKSLYTERALVQFTRLVVGMIHDFLPESEWMKMVSGYPVQVLRALRQRAKRLEYDIRVEVVSGHGQTRIQKQAEAREQFAMGLRGPTSTMKILGINDVEREIRDIMTNPLSRVAQQIAAQQQAQTSPASGSRADSSPA
ncbi:MAG TPA: hypothetical protein VF184_03745, partial [Phycisphaeraceae bacterium]